MDTYKILYSTTIIIFFAIIFYLCCRRRNRGAVLVPPPTTTIVVPPSQSYQAQAAPYPVQGMQPAFNFTPAYATHSAPYPAQGMQTAYNYAPGVPPQHTMGAPYPHHTVQSPAAPTIGFSYPTQGGYPHHTAQNPPSYSEAVSQEAYSKQAPFNPAYPH